MRLTHTTTPRRWHTRRSAPSILSDCGGGSAVNEDVMHFVKQWLVTHIKGSDMAYAGKV
eukprot:EC791188.1.p4 GENE.EC791188.1~~EC791188.1.p4  ORF type:complete len:59 (+),score=14.03 EC791188.1:262-438(+)